MVHTHHPQINPAAYTDVMPKTLLRLLVTTEFVLVVGGESLTPDSRTAP